MLLHAGTNGNDQEIKQSNLERIASGGKDTYQAKLLSNPKIQKALHLK